ncbi:MAG TPA: TfoX/Sxy family protein [Puia sp.]|jgi:hypothetical protein|nr:TfoX/Sxy family protein [Puia sp.]
MPINEQLASHVRTVLKSEQIPFKEEEQSGLCFMVNGNICINVRGNALILRVGSTAAEAAIGKEGCWPMTHNGKSMTGYVYFEKGALQIQKDLDHWIGLAMKFNNSAGSGSKATWFRR